MGPIPHTDGHDFPRLVTQQVPSVAARAKEEPDVYCNLDMFFLRHEDWENDLQTIFKGHENVLYAAYFASCKTRDHFDFDSRLLNKVLDTNPDFLLEFLIFLQQDKEYYSYSQDFNVLCARKDITVLLNKVIEHICNKGNKDHEFYRFEEILKNLFSIQHDEIKGSADILKKQDQFITEFISKHALNEVRTTLIFDLITYFEEERRLRHISTFMEYNDRFDAFKRIRLEPSSWGWSGSEVPVVAKQIDFYEKVKEMCKGLKFIEHRQLMEERLSHKYQYLERVKKREFISDDF